MRVSLLIGAAGELVIPAQLQLALLAGNVADDVNTSEHVTAASWSGTCQ